MRDASAPTDLTASTAATAATRPALLVINGRSRTGGDDPLSVRAALDEAGVPVREELCSSAEHLPDLIRAAAPEVGCALIGGGDGTLNAALPGLLDTGLALGILPLGTANDLARTLGIAPDLAVAARVIAAGRRRRIDVGEANGRPFFNVASVGFGVDLTRALTHDAKKRWGVLGYAVAALRVLRRTRSFTVEIEEDGHIQRGRTIHLAVGNGRHYGGGMTMSEQASITDGRFDVYSLEVRALWHLLALLPAIRHGRHGRWREVRTLTGSDLTVRTRRPRSVNTDGEITTETPVRFRVLPGAVEVFAP